METEEARRKGHATQACPTSRLACEMPGGTAYICLRCVCMCVCLLYSFAGTQIRGFLCFKSTLFHDTTVPIELAGQLQENQCSS